jgi:hypothetical protein
MLVEFRVTNFRSLRDEQVFTMVASKDKSLYCTHSLVTGVRALPGLLRSAVVYGANASGKSNLIKALQFMRSVVTESATVIHPGQVFNLQPFRLDRLSAEQPSEFEVTFLIDGVRYQYGFAMTAQRILGEHLLVYKASKPQRWFERRFDETTGKDLYEFGSGLKGPKNVWEGATRPNSLFLSMAAQLNSDALRPVLDWFAKALIIYNDQSPLAPNISIQKLRRPQGHSAICNFLGSADMSISNIDVIHRKVSDNLSDADPMAIHADASDDESEDVLLRFHHSTEHGSAVFGSSDESSGTRNLLYLSGPVFDVLEKGHTLVIDELDTSLHTLLVRELVGMFHRPDARNGAQLIFPTHDTSLLDAPDLFRRDQVWFVEKNRDQASTLAALSDFSPRKNEALEKGYLQGRYGGVPLLGKIERGEHERPGTTLRRNARS